MTVVLSTADRQGMDGDAVISWNGLRNGDSGAPIALSAPAALHIQATGDLSTGTVTIQGSNVKIPTEADWANVIDKTGVPLIFNSTSSFKVADSVPRWLRPAVAGDDATRANVLIMIRTSK